VVAGFVVGEEPMASTWLIVGLGNPGPRYEATRHNIGQMVVDELAARRTATLRAHRSNARVAETWLRPGADKLVLAKPNSFMNVSGGPVSSLATYYGVPAERVVVVHDELDIPFETLKLKVGGGHGGHNGVRDVAKALGTADFPRVRVGIGRPPGRQDPADWVLDPFPASQREQLALLIGDGADAVEELVEHGLLAAQQRHHAPRA
jgi:PTH1 family peptidyl-tRNA hydrolase